MNQAVKSREDAVAAQPLLKRKVVLKSNDNHVVGQKYRPSVDIISRLPKAFEMLRKM